MHNITENGDTRDIRVTSYADTSPVVLEDEDADDKEGKPADADVDDDDKESEDADGKRSKPADADADDAGAENLDAGERNEVGHDVADRHRQLVGV